jgi:hypothetical protein
MAHRRRYTNRMPIFITRSNFPLVSHSEYELPVRDYYWLTKWDAHDSPKTPMFWSSFKLSKPESVVLYLTIGGSEEFTISNEFAMLLAPLSNRIEKAQLLRYEDIRRN